MVTDVMHDETCIALAEVLAGRNEGFMQLTLAKADGTTLDHLEKIAEVSGRPPASKKFRSWRRGVIYPHRPFILRQENRMAPMTRLIRLAAVALLGSANALCPPALAAQSLLILVRHAERPPEVEGDPDLTPAGKARAQKLATMLAESGIRAVFTSEFKRTQETARPLATKLGIPPEVVPAADTSALVDKLEDHPTETVLVVGHADTVAEIIKARGGPTVTIADDQFDDIFVFVPATGALTRIKY